MNRFRVFFGFLAAVVYAVFSHAGPTAVLAAGLVVSFLGLLLRGWAAGYLEKGKRLAQDGPYAYWRHPLYGGSFLLAIGFCVAGTNPARPGHAALIWVVFALLFLGVYPRRVRDEEFSLEKYFGDAWRTYAGNTHRFWPRLSPLRRPDPDRFRLERYLKNREYNAAAGWLAGVALLALKAAWGI